MNDNIKKALAAAAETKALVVGNGVINQLPALFKEQFPGKTAVIIADSNTFQILGEKAYSLLKAAGIPTIDPYIIPVEIIYAEYKFNEQITAFLKTNEAIPVAVGSGTVNDLCKVSAHESGRQYMVVGTAASMDGYTSFGASITKDGAKQTINCPAPQAVLGDLDVICKAPADMTASGYADLLSKIPAGADWILADALGVEPIDEIAFHIVQDGLASALGSPKQTREGDPEAISRLFEGLVLGGFAMQKSRTSRPASGADHQFSHLWDMEHHKHNGVAPSHGFKVSIGSLASLSLHNLLLKEDISNLDIEACVAAWPSQEEQDRVAAELFAGTDFPTIGITETRAKAIDKDGLRIQLTTLKNNWPKIKADLEKQLPSTEDIVNRLKLVGAPTSPEEIGITRERLRESFIRAQHLRRRFTILDVAVRINKMNDWLDILFGKGGIWEIRN